MKRRTFFQVLGALVTAYPRGKKAEAVTTVVTPQGKPWTEKEFNKMEFGVVTGSPVGWPCECGARIVEGEHELVDRVIRCKKCGQEYQISVRYPTPDEDPDDNFVEDAE